jgi:hypothetical protein
MPCSLEQFKMPTDDEMIEALRNQVARNSLKAEEKRRRLAEEDEARKRREAEERFERAVRTANELAAMVSLQNILDQMRTRDRAIFDINSDVYYKIVCVLPDETRNRVSHLPTSSLNAFVESVPTRLTDLWNALDRAGLQLHVDDNTEVIGENRDGYPEYWTTDRWTIWVAPK